MLGVGVGRFDKRTTANCMPPNLTCHEFADITLMATISHGKQHVGCASKGAVANDCAEAEVEEAQKRPQNSRRLSTALAICDTAYNPPTWIAYQTPGDRCCMISLLGKA